MRTGKLTTVLYWYCLLGPLASNSTSICRVPLRGLIHPRYKTQKPRKTHEMASGDSRAKEELLAQEESMTIQTLTSLESDRGLVEVDLIRAISALHRMRTTVGLLGHAVVRQEAATAQRRTISLLETTKAVKRRRLEDPETKATSKASCAKMASDGDDDRIDDQWMTIMSQTIRAERLAEILRDLDELQEKLILEMEDCAVDRLA